MLEYKICGPIFDEGIPLHVATNALQVFNGIVDKSYLVYSGSKRISARDRDIFQLRASSISHGSLLTNFEIVFSTIQLVLPFAGSFDHKNIWEFTKNSFDLLKIVCNSVQHNQKPTYELNKNGKVTVNTGDVHHHYHAPVIQIAELSLQNFQQLAHLIEPKKLTKYQPVKQTKRNQIFILAKTIAMLSISQKKYQMIIYL